MRTISLLRSGFMTLSLIAATSFPAMALDASKLDAVEDDRGNYVLDDRGNCVRTKWTNNDGDPCGKPEEVLAAPVVPETLHSEELIVYFEFDKAVLTDEAKRKLDEIATILGDSKGLVSARVVGYADRIGTDNYNQRLSQRRANAVETYLATKGYVPAEKAEIRALGESASKDRCLGVEARADLIRCLWKERKVEVKLDYNK